MNADEMMERMGFARTERGPYVSALRRRVAKQIANGMVKRSAGTWAPGAEKLDAEARAKALLAWDWELENGHSFEVKQMDPVRNWRHAVRWIGDRWREAKMQLRIWRDRHIRRVTNPYA